MKKLISTTGLSHEEWLKYRKLGIGGSDAGAICGLNPYVSSMSVYFDKIQEETEDYDNEAMRQGRDLEEYVAKRFTEATGFKVRRMPFIRVIYIRLCWQMWIVMLVGENIGLECKTASAYSSDKWAGDLTPSHYEVQCHYYMAVTRASACIGQW